MSESLERERLSRMQCPARGAGHCAPRIQSPAQCPAFEPETTRRTAAYLRIQCPAQCPAHGRTLFIESAQGGRREPVSGSPARPIGPGTAGRGLPDAVPGPPEAKVMELLVLGAATGGACLVRGRGVRFRLAVDNPPRVEPPRLHAHAGNVHRHAKPLRRRTLPGRPTDRSTWGALELPG